MRQEEQHATHGAVAMERPQPTPAMYIAIAIVLTAVTAVEVGVYYVDALRSAFLPIFLGLSAVKFALVAMFYMHLRFDSRLFSVLFFGGLALATAIAFALMVLFGAFQT
jgi:cytochrome c oxidase subunit 4